MSEEEKQAYKYLEQAMFEEETTERYVNILLNLIDKLQKENEELTNKLSKTQCDNRQLESELEKANKQMDLDYVDNNFISKDEIKQLVGYEENEDVSKDVIISLLKTMWEEFNRLENIEDKMLTKCVNKDIIRNFIKEELPDDEIMKSCEMFDMNGVYLRKKLEELLNS